MAAEVMSFDPMKTNAYSEGEFWEKNVFDLMLMNTIYMYIFYHDHAWLPWLAWTSNMHHIVACQAHPALVKQFWCWPVYLIFKWSVSMYTLRTVSGLA